MCPFGQTKRTAFLSAVILGGATLLGMGLMFLLRGTVAFALPFSAGVTLYVAASDLIPEVNREPKFGMAVMVFAGVAVMLGLKAIFHL